MQTVNKEMSIQYVFIISYLHKLWRSK